MSMNDEIRKTLSDPKPFYALAGAGDLAAEKLKDAPAFLTEVAESVTTLANRIAAEAPERIAAVRSKLGETQANLNLDPRNLDLKNLDPRAARENLREAAGKVDVQALRDKVDVQALRDDVQALRDKVDVQALRDKAQTVALMQVGRALEVAGKAVETYDGLAERGKTVVGRYRGQGGSESAPSDEHVTVIVEQVGPDAVEEADKKTAQAGGESVVIDDVVDAHDEHRTADDAGPKSAPYQHPGATGSAATGTGPSRSGTKPSAPKPSTPKPSAPKQTPKPAK